MNKRQSTDCGGRPLKIVTRDNIEQEHICCAMSDKKVKRGVELKKEWLKDRFEEGLMFKKLDVKGKVFIEHLPAEYAWVPISAPGYTFINCFWVSGRFKGQGYGAQLLEECMQDSKAKGKHGIVVISSKKKRPYLSDGGYLKKKGFQVCDTAPPYFELLVYKLDPNAPSPHFTASAKDMKIPNQNGLVVYYTNQCPYTDYYIHQELANITQQYHIPFKCIQLTSREDAQHAPCAFTTYGAFYNGEFLTHEILSAKKFKKIMMNIGQI